MRTAATGLFLAALLLTPLSASADDPVSAASRRVEASLALPADLDGPSYLELVRAVRPRKLYDVTRDPHMDPYGESGRWRVHVPIRLDLAAVVIPFDGTPYLLGLANFAYPRASRGKIDPRPYERAIIRAISFR